MQTKNSDELMLIVTAEGNSSWLREKLHPGSWVRYFGEGLIPDYKSKMQTLRQVDDRIAYWLGDLDSYVKKMEKALSANHLVALVGLLAEVNHKLKNAVNDGKEVANISQDALKEFDEGPSGLLPDFSEELDEKLAKSQDQLLKTSWDWWDQKKREWVARRFEDKEREKRRLALARLVDITRVTVMEVQEQLKVLGKARASGQIGAYIDGLKKISAIQRKFHAQFSPIYVKYLAPIVKRIKQREEAEREIGVKEVKTAPKSVPVPAVVQDSPDPETESMPSIPKTEPMFGSPPSNSLQPSSVDVDLEELEAPSHSGERPTLRSIQLSGNPFSSAPQTPVSGVPVPSLSGGSTAPVSEMPVVPSFGNLARRVVPVPAPPAVVEDQIPETVPDTVEPKPAPKPEKAKRVRKKSAAVETAWLKQVNAKFYDELKQAAQQDNPYLLGWMLTKHAELIAEVDEDQSLKLLQIAESILNG